MTTTVGLDGPLNNERTAASGHSRSGWRSLEDAGGCPEARPSPFTVWYGSFEAWVESEVLPGIESGALDAAGMIVIVACLRRWEEAGTWANPYAG